MVKKFSFVVLTFFSLIFSLGYAASPISSCQDIFLSGEYVLTSDLNESGSTQCLDIYRSDVVIDCDFHKVSFFPAIKSVFEDNVTVKNCIFEGSGSETVTDLKLVSNFNFENNVFRNVGEGISLIESNDNVISSNIFENTNTAISLVNSNNNVIDSGEVLSGEAFYLYESSNNAFTNYEIFLSSTPFLDLGYFDDSSMSSGNSFDLSFSNFATPLIKLHTSDLITSNSFSELLFYEEVSFDLSPAENVPVILEDSFSNVRYNSNYISNDLVSIPSFIFDFDSAVDVGVEVDEHIYALSNKSLEPYTIKIDSPEFVSLEEEFYLNETSESGGLEFELIYSEKPVVEFNISDAVIFINESVIIDLSGSIDSHYSIFEYVLLDSNGSIISSSNDGFFELDNSTLDIGLHTFYLRVVNEHNISSDDVSFNLRVVSTDAPIINSVNVVNSLPIFDDESIEFSVDASNDYNLTSFEVYSGVTMLGNSLDSSLTISALDKGTHTLEFIVSNEFGVSNYAYLDVEVISTELPVAVFDEPMVGYYLEDFIVSASSSYDLNNYSLEVYTFLDGDGLVLSSSNESDLNLGNSSLIGTYPIKVHVENEYGIISSIIDSSYVIVNGTLPVIFNMTLDKNTVYEGESLTITINSSDLNSYEITKVNVYRDGVLFATANDSNSIVLENMSLGSYNFTVKVENEFFKESLAENFMIDVITKPVPRSGGGSSSSRSSSNSDPNVYIITESDIVSGKKVSFTDSDVLIFNFRDKTAQFDVDEVTNGYLTMSGFKSVQMNLGARFTFDIDYDGVKDIEVKFNSVDNEGYATVWVEEIIPEPIVVPLVIEEPVPEVIVEEIVDDGYVSPEITLSGSADGEPEISLGLAGQVTSDKGNIFVSVIVFALMMSGFVYVFKKRKIPRDPSSRSKNKPKDFGF